MVKAIGSFFLTIKMQHNSHLNANTKLDNTLRNPEERDET